MKTTKDEYVEVYKDYIQTLIQQQAQLVIEINSLQTALYKHEEDSCKYYLTYHYDDETGVYSYKREREKKIGF